jgi:hypothetical protein
VLEMAVLRIGHLVHHVKEAVLSTAIIVGFGSWLRNVSYAPSGVHVP